MDHGRGNAGVRVTRRRLSEPSFAFLLNAPALLAIVGLVGYPIVYSLWLSLHRYNLKRPNVFRFIGVQNYVEIFGSEEFWAALQVTLAFTALGVALVVALAIVIALLLNEPFPGRGFVRTVGTRASSTARRTTVTSTSTCTTGRPPRRPGSTSRRSPSRRSSKPPSP
jgi:ABC-type sugar transport system permease subunit